MTRRRTVSARILLSFLLVLVLFTLASTWSVVSFRQAVSEAALLRQGYLPLALSLRDLVANQDSWNSQLNHVTTARNPADARAWFETALAVGRPRKVQEVKDAILTAFEEPDVALARKELMLDLERASSLMKQDDALVRQLFVQLERGAQPEAQATRDELVRQGLRVQRTLTALEKRVSAHMDRLLRAAKEREHTALMILIFLSGLTLLVGFLMALYANRVLSPLGRVTRRAERVAQGDLSVQPAVASNDEIGELSQTFESMVRAIAEAREKLLASERLAAIGKMAAHVTHEVRNPLSSIALNLELLDDEIDGENAEAKQLVTAIGQEVTRLAALSDQYLSMAKRKAPEVEECDISQVVRGAADFMRRDLKRQNIELQLSIVDALPWVLVDQGQLRQVLFNLLRNAREAMSDGGSVDVSVRVEGEELVIAVADTGPGVPETEVAQLFDPFYTTKSHGTGLGLAVTVQIMQAHGGRLEYKPNTPRGAVFVVTLPLIHHEPTAHISE